MTIAYCKALPTPIDELNALGKTQLEMFLTACTPIFHKAVCETVNFMMSGCEFKKSHGNRHLQATYGISARDANGVIPAAAFAVEGAALCRILHVKTLEGNAKSCEMGLKKSDKKLKSEWQFYAVKQGRNSIKSCVFPLSCCLKYRPTNWQSLKFQIHNKQRNLYRYQQKIAALRLALSAVEEKR